MRLLICGSRDWVDKQPDGTVFNGDHWEKMNKWINWATDGLREGEMVTIIEGCALGADRMAERFATDREWTNEHYPADWQKYGKAAGPIRNRQMLLDGKPDLVLAFHKNNSKGTQHMVDIATASGVPVKVVK